MNEMQLHSYVDQRRPTAEVPCWIKILRQATTYPYPSM